LKNVGGRRGKCLVIPKGINLEALEGD
jgi:hypothetical protein